MAKQTKSSIDIQSKPLKHKNGDMLNDVELCKYALKTIDDYTEKFGKPPKIQPKFVAWLRNAVDYCDKGGNMVDYKEKYIYKEFEPLYDEIIENTNKRNTQLSKKGEFKPKIISQIKGESK